MNISKPTFSTVAIAVFCIFVIVFLLRRWRRESFSKFSQAELSDAAFGQMTSLAQPTIFVSVASYRDDQCFKTIEEMFAKAARPDRVFVGVVEQNKYDDKVAAERENCIRRGTVPQKQVQRMKLDYTEARGPTKARQLAATLWKGQTYFMQIDSHITFVKNWDEIAIAELKKCPNPERTVLTAYPLDDQSYTEKSTELVGMCGSKLNDDGLPVPTAKMLQPSVFGGKPKRTAFVAAGFFFVHADWLKKVPFDPGLDHLFQGEEILLAARSHTAGYDMYMPSRNITLHSYLRHEKPKFWSDLKGWDYQNEKRKSEKRARRILGLDSPVVGPGTDNYGLGMLRSIESYWKLAGIDPHSKTSSKDHFC